MTQPRSSLAIALQDYKGPRPGIALTIAAVALLLAVVVGAFHVITLGRAGGAIVEGQQTIATLHRYNAALEVWRQMSLKPDSELQYPAQRLLRDSIQTALTENLLRWRDQMTDTVDQRLAGEVVEDLRQSAAKAKAANIGIGEQGRTAMLLLAGRQENALFAAVERYRQSQFLAAVLIGLTIIAAGVLIVPMSWAYVRYKRGIPPGM
jgi:hypothetical protein